ncbi:MAG TPA: hypothetical protein P5136_01365 [Methanofastidiosum sp.]|nr:hypothetical protein [Methanofastidiosum sp.]
MAERVTCFVFNLPSGTVYVEMVRDENKLVEKRFTFIDKNEKEIFLDQGRL